MHGAHALDDLAGHMDLDLRQPAAAAEQFPVSGDWRKTAAITAIEPKS
jgi:hypothetical protein